jgi:hypothetical protein
VSPQSLTHVNVATDPARADLASHPDAPALGTDSTFRQLVEKQGRAICSHLIAHPGSTPDEAFAAAFPNYAPSEDSKTLVHLTDTELCPLVAA